MTPGPWLVPVVGLRRAPGSARDEHRSGRIAGLRVAGAAVPAAAPVEVDVTLTALDGGVEVAGTVSAPWEGSCRRCLRPVGGRLEAEVRELYRPAGRAGSDDEETYPLGADHLDLEPLARDAVLLALPLAPLCRDDCAGLCPHCGADLAEGPCSCRPPPADPRWAALDALRAGAPGAGGAPGPSSD